MTITDKGNMPKANPYREALICYRLKGLSYLETSKVVGIPKSTARKWYEEWKMLCILPMEDAQEIISASSKISKSKTNNITLKLIVLFTLLALLNSNSLIELV